MVGSERRNRRLNFLGMMTRKFGKVEGKAIFQKYNAYLLSPEWNARRQAAFEAYGKACQRCGATNRILTVHHRHYETVYAEQPEDLEILCGDCHRGEHRYQQKPIPAIKRVKMADKKRSIRLQKREALVRDEKRMARRLEKLERGD